MNLTFFLVGQGPDDPEAIGWGGIMFGSGLAGGGPTPAVALRHCRGEWKSTRIQLYGTI